jgi:hypothetical protein
VPDRTCGLLPSLRGLAPCLRPRRLSRRGYRALHLFLDLLREGTIAVDHLITHRAQPEEAPALYVELAAGPGEWMGVEFVWES